MANPGGAAAVVVGFDVEGATLVRELARAGDVAALTAMFRVGAPVNGVDADGCTALMIAAAEGHEPVVRAPGLAIGIASLGFYFVAMVENANRCTPASPPPRIVVRTSWTAPDH